MMAYRLGKTFNTGTKYWIDLQSASDVGQLIKADGADSKFIDSVERYSEMLYAGVQRSTYKGAKDHPGKFLFRQFIVRSRISTKDWSHLFCVSTQLFNKILAGKSEMPAKLMMKVCKVFKTDISFWLGMQNQFYAVKAEQDCKKLNRQPLKIPTAPMNSNLSHPFEVLTEAFLKPMGISTSYFMRHIEVSRMRFDHSTRGRKKIDYELAIRIGQALETGPLFWVNLQLEYDIKVYENERGEGSVHLH
jgi:addiction module HigA family antidote